MLDLLAAGCGNHAIADRLHLSEKTARNHVSALLLRLGARDRGALLVTAMDAGLGGAGSTRSGVERPFLDSPPPP